MSTLEIIVILFYRKMLSKLSKVNGQGCRNPQIDYKHLSCT